MPLADKLERISALLQSGTLSQEEFHQAKDHLLKPAAPAVKDAPDARKMRDRWLKDLAQAERTYRIARHRCLVRDRHSGLREPRAAHFYVLGSVTVIWLGLGSLAVAGFLAVNRTLALLPAGTMLMGFFFLLRAMLAHAVRMIRLKVAKRRWEQDRARIQEQIGLV